MKQLDLFRSSARAINPSGNKPDSVTSSADWGNEVCGIYFLSLGSTRGGEYNSNKVLNSAGRTVNMAR